MRDWKDVSLLMVAVDRLERWSRPGLLCIGGAAHAMSPIGGVGINLAIQDAAAAANILGPITLLARVRKKYSGGVGERFGPTRGPSTWRKKMDCR